MNRPTLVEAAVRLIWCAVAASTAASALVILEIIRARTDPPQLVATLVVLGGALTLATVWLTLKVRQGNNWARWIYVAVAALSLRSIADMPVELEASAIGRWLSVICTLLFITSGALLLTPIASRWFQRG